MPSFPLLEGRISVDAAVIGAGITGLTAALLLKLSGKTVAVIDKSSVAGGESGFTTAHLSEIIDTPYRELIRQFGAEKAHQIALSKRAAMKEIEGLIGKFEIDCQWETVPGYLYAETAEQEESLLKELEALQKVGIPAQYGRDVPLPYVVRCGLRIENQAQFHPLLYLRALAERVTGGGSHIFEDSPAMEFKDGEPCRVITPRGEIEAKDVIIACNVPVSNRFLIHTKLAAYRSYAVAVAMQSLNLEGLFWDLQDPYHYIRRQKMQIDDEVLDVLIVGGEDHKTGAKKETEECFRALEEYVHGRFGPVPLRYRWSGQIIETVDGLPYIGKNSFSDHFYIASGYSGNGMTFGTLAAMIICDLILERSNPWARLYDATRVNLSSAPDYLVENKDYPAHFLFDLLGTERSHLNEIQPGEGKTLRKGMHGVAAYRDERGEFHFFSAVCPHLGCLVQWNGAEKSWDCPCHGSRFGPQGQVINGPAVCGLKPAEFVEPAHRP